MIFFFQRWFDKLNKHFQVNGHASFFYKPVGANKTTGVTGKLANEKLKKLLKTKDVAFIYHCYNHYCCPIGFESEPVDRSKVYNYKSDEIDQRFVDWFLLADTSRKYSSFHCVKWSDIEFDLNTISPEYINIRHLERGVQTRRASSANSSSHVGENEASNEAADKRRSNSANKNLHCIIQFRKTSSKEIRPEHNGLYDLDLKSITTSDVNLEINYETKQELISSSLQFLDEEED